MFIDIIQKPIDEQNQLHEDNIPAIQFTDNFSVCANHGNILDFAAKSIMTYCKQYIYIV